MKKRRTGIKWAVTALLVACIGVAVLAVSGATPENGASTLFDTPVREFTVSGSTVHVYEKVLPFPGGTLQLKGWTLPDADSCVMGSWQTEKNSSWNRTLWRTETGRKTLTIRYFDGERWIVDTMKEGVYGSGTAYFISGDEYELMCYAPMGWQLLENGSRQLLSDKQGWLRTEKKSEGWTVSLCAPGMVENCASDFLCLTASEPLISWEKPNTENLWSTYCNNGEGRWCIDGYYFISPESYVPTGENVFYRMAGAYLCNSFVHQYQAARAARDLVLCMTDVLLEQMEEGFFPTLAESEWLSGEYGIGPGFYDTRFNSDLMEIVVNLWNRNKSESYITAMENYCRFYVNFAENFHMETVGGGWLVPDYWGPNMQTIPHTSLNHQLAETMVLYKMAKILEREDLQQLADKMFLAVEDTGLNWVREDSNLHYSISRDGVYGGEDYPELTYNDLFDMQNLLEQQGKERNPVLTAIMENKKKWMDANNVTGYKK